MRGKKCLLAEDKRLAVVFAKLDEVTQCDERLAQSFARQGR